MKVKLLRKVRKRFEIFHLPKGFMFDGQHFNYDLFKLVDIKDTLGLNPVYVQLEGKNINEIKFCEKVFNTKEECIYYLKSRIIKRLRREGHTQRRDKNITSVKVWRV